MHIKINELARYLISFIKKELISTAGYQEMEKPHWVYDGSNGNSKNGLLQSYGLGMHLARGTKETNDCVFRVGELAIGHMGRDYGLASSMYFDAHGVGVVCAINGA